MIFCAVFIKPGTTNVTVVTFWLSGRRMRGAGLAGYL